MEPFPSEGVWNYFLYGQIQWPYAEAPSAILQWPRLLAAHSWCCGVHVRVEQSQCKVKTARSYHDKQGVRRHVGNKETLRDSQKLCFNPTICFFSLRQLSNFQNWSSYSMVVMGSHGPVFNIYDPTSEDLHARIWTICCQNHYGTNPCFLIVKSDWWGLLGSIFKSLGGQIEAPTEEEQLFRFCYTLRGMSM